MTRRYFHVFKNGVKGRADVTCIRPPANRRDKEKGQVTFKICFNKKPPFDNHEAMEQELALWQKEFLDDVGRQCGAVIENRKALKLPTDDSSYIKQDE